MQILPWIRHNGKNGTHRVLAFLYNNTILWTTDDVCHDEELLCLDYLIPNGLILGKDSFWSDDKTVWFPEISMETNLSDFYFQKDLPPDDILRWVQYYWTKEDLGVNEFHRNQKISETMTIYDFLKKVLVV
jgi:hypothetical protein